MAAMFRELKVKTLAGVDLTIEVTPTNTVEELKAMLCKKKLCEDPTEQEVCQVKVLAVGLSIDDDHQTLESAGLLHAESEVTVIYSRNVVEAATKEAIHAKGLLQVNIPFGLTEIPAGAFKNCNQVLKVAIPESVIAIGRSAFEGCNSLASINLPGRVTTIRESAFRGCSSLANICLPKNCILERHSP